MASMEPHSQHIVKYVERVSGGVIITFADGKCALFKDDLLYATLSQAQELNDLDDGEPSMA